MSCNKCIIRAFEYIQQVMTFFVELLKWYLQIFQSSSVSSGLCAKSFSRASCFLLWIFVKVPFKEVDDKVLDAKQSFFIDSSDDMRHLSCVTRTGMLKLGYFFIF